MVELPALERLIHLLLQTSRVQGVAKSSDKQVTSVSETRLVKQSARPLAQ